jgi:hypothetical protein
MVSKLNFFRRGKTKKELLSVYTLMVQKQGEKLLRVPQITYAVVENFNLIDNEISSRGFSNPYEVCIMVGSLSARENLGNIGEYTMVKENLSKLSEEEIEGEISKVASRHADCDLFLVVKREISPYTRRELALAFKSTLPKFNIENFEYEIHDDSIASRSKMLSNFTLARNGNLPLLLEHEREIFERNPKKEKVPVILARTDSLHPELEKELEFYVENGYLRTLQNYLNTTWKDYLRSYKVEFPKSFERIFNDIKVEVENSNLSDSSKKNILSSFAKI